MLTLCIRGDFVIKLINQYKVIALIILLIFVNFLFILYQNIFSSEPILVEELKHDVASVMTEELNESQLETESEEESIRTLDIPIFICGEVEKPGVYYVNSNSIVQDVLDIAGGFSENANKEYVNLAQLVDTNQKIYIPKMGEEIDKINQAYDNTNQGDIKKLVNINLADQPLLETLPGIGPSKAQQIIDHREKQGAFKNIEDLKNVSGIGTKTYESLKELITIQ